MLTSSSRTQYVLNSHDDVDQNDLYAIPSKIIPCQSYPESLVNENEIPIELLLTSSSDTNISLTSMKVSTNMAHLHYHSI